MPGLRAFATGALFLLLLAGCARPRDATAAASPAEAASLHVADRDLDGEPRVVSGPEALADLATAVRAFEEAYAGLDGAPRTPAPARIAAARAKIAARATWSPRELAEELRALFAQPDGHLAFGYGGRAPLRLPALPSDAPPASLTSADDAVRFTPGPIPVVAIRTFDSAAKPALDALPAIARRLRRAPAFVVDVRGNGGGNFAFAEAFVLALTSAKLRRLDEREVRSAEAEEGRSNSVRRRLAAGGVPAAALPFFAAQLARLDADGAALRAEGAPRAETVIRGATVIGTARGPLRSRAVILVDRGCASACEMMVALARQIPGVILAGEPTRGGMAVGELAFFRLPASGVTISLGTRAFRDPLGAFAEGRGFLPDVRLDGADPIAEARRIALGAAPLERVAATETPGTCSPR